MKILGLIPARYASTRFPGKPLIDICGKSMIQRVYEQALKANCLTKVVVATDDERIFSHVEGFGGNAILTSSEHQSGTDRCAEVAEHFSEYEAFINIQGDEPLIDPKQIDLLGEKISQTDVRLATLIKKIDILEELQNPNTPKVICRTNGEAIYFSRQTIPHIRETEPIEWLNKHTFFKHIGIYAYKRETLKQIAKLEPSKLEKAESLEQLRWIEHGFPIHTVVTTIETLAVDTPEDLKRIIELIQS